MKQLEFDFLNDIDCYDINNFIVNSSNIEAYNYLNNIDNKDHFIFLNGEEKSGKTYLSMLWKQKVNARNINFDALNKMPFEDFIYSINNIIEPFDYYIVDDLVVDFNEEKLFYLLNSVLSNNSIILITSVFDIFKSKILLKDLKSRIRVGINLKIKKFCKDTKCVYIAKLLSDKKLFLSDDLLKYLTKKLPNNYKDLYFKLDEIVSSSIGEKITLSKLKSFFHFL